MIYAKQITEMEGRETGFLIHYFNLPGQNYTDQFDTFHTELVIGYKKCLILHSKYKNFPNSLDGKVMICGSFHTHSYKKYLNNYENSKTVDENRLAYIKERCQNCLSFDDLETVLVGIMKRDPKCMITCVLSDIEDRVSCYIPKKHVSVDEFARIYDRFKKDRQLSMCTETICTQEGLVTFPTLEYKKMCEYVLDLFDEKKFDLNSGETIIDI